MQDASRGGEFVGRQRELSQLRHALDDAQRRHGQILLVTGEAGIGKTRLAQEFAAIAASGSVTVLWGRCVQSETSPPYWPWARDRPIVCGAMHGRVTASYPRPRG